MLQKDFSANGAHIAHSPLSNQSMNHGKTPTWLSLKTSTERYERWFRDMLHKLISFSTILSITNLTLGMISLLMMTLIKLLLTITSTKLGTPLLMIPTHTARTTRVKLPSLNNSNTRSGLESGLSPPMCVLCGLEVSMTETLSLNSHARKLIAQRAIFQRNMP